MGHVQYGKAAGGDPRNQEHYNLACGPRLRRKKSGRVKWKLLFHDRCEHGCGRIKGEQPCVCDGR